MNHYYRIKRAARWMERFKEEFPFTTKLEKEIGKYLGMMPWTRCSDKDAFESHFFIFMENITAILRDHQYYYGRILLSNIVLYSSPQVQMKVLRLEVNELLCELLVLIKEGVEEGKITGRISPLMGEG